MYPAVGGSGWTEAGPAGYTYAVIALHAEGGATGAPHSGEAPAAPHREAASTSHGRATGAPHGWATAAPHGGKATGAPHDGRATGAPHSGEAPAANHHEATAAPHSAALGTPRDDMLAALREVRFSGWLAPSDSSGWVVAVAGSGAGVTASGRRGVVGAAEWLAERLAGTVVAVRVVDDRQLVLVVWLDGLEVGRYVSDPSWKLDDDEGVLSEPVGAEHAHALAEACGRTDPAGGLAELLAQELDTEAFIESERLAGVLRLLGMPRWIVSVASQPGGRSAAGPRRADSEHGTGPRTPERPRTPEQAPTPERPPAPEQPRTQEQTPEQPRTQEQTPAQKQTPAHEWIRLGMGRTGLAGRVWGWAAGLVRRRWTAPPVLEDPPRGAGPDPWLL